MIVDVSGLERAVEQEIAEQLHGLRQLSEANEHKVFSAFTDVHVAETDMHGSTGYGYDDTGRARLDQLFARVFGAEAGLVRPAFVSGTHALATALFALLRPGDTLIYASGAPYDTLQPVIGIGADESTGEGSLCDLGVRYVELTLCGGGIDTAALAKAAAEAPGKVVVALQRTPGYANRSALSVAQIAEAVRVVRSVRLDARVIVDNCYGEFTEEWEPTDVGADLAVGSLIKNPGGGIVPAGGYVVGTRSAVHLCACRLTAPGIAGKAGAHEVHRLYFQGLFLAPHVVGQALSGAAFAAAALRRTGFDVASHGNSAEIPEMIVRVRLGSAAKLERFCQAIARSFPVDAHVRPVPGPMPGYAHDVIMATGGFVQGGSLELSVDGPLREPFVAYLQGGLTYAHVKYAVLRAIGDLTST
ncbi:MAG: methionine gamma-lyase family protein [Firmicutes bacterium]|nr:methionine gamma-lyase family protein [Bacillota bacterium]